jgi:hypothetical protein
VISAVGHALSGVATLSRMRAPVGHVLGFLLAVVGLSCVPTSARPNDRDAAPSSPTPAGPDAIGSQDSSPDQTVYFGVFQDTVAQFCSPTSFFVPCYFQDQAGCERAVQAQWPACEPDAALPDSSAARWGAGERMGECISHGAIGERKPRLEDPVCRSRFPKKRIENPYLDAGAGSGTRR